ncbi:MAG TPA: DUF4450 domain-containing protein, partial [Balneolales bacterium]|nr:DUF4450 domain-containing protein [Balneolales bacterium]
GTDFVITNGKQRFNRALYGTHTAFRVESGDLPEFALFMPGMGGTLKFGLLNGHASKWLIEADKITARYRPGSMIYEVRDGLLGDGALHLQVLAMSDAEGFVVRIDFEHISDENLRLAWAFGGSSDDHFKRNGDIGADPVSGFFLLPEHCRGNEFEVNGHSFVLRYGKDHDKSLAGVFDPKSDIHIADATRQKNPSDFIASEKSDTPVLAGSILASSDRPIFLNIYNPDTHAEVAYSSVPDLFEQAGKARDELVNRVKVATPDPFINPFGGALSVAGDAIWQPPSYLHGAVAWRERLNGWRGPYVADPLGWHERARMHFSSYAKSQLTRPDSGPVVPDSKEHLAREEMKIGTAVYTSGYICPKPEGHFSVSHYDMNLCYIDELLWHFRWTGNWSYIKEMWPVIKRHLAWEKRCFDGNDDGLYDAYACIWASDALQYSGGGVTHSSAYNCRTNELAAFIAERIGEDASPYRAEAKKIRDALQSRLWMPEHGRYAEYQDLQGLQKNHPQPALWTIYHAIDKDIADPFMTYQLLRYVDTEIPHIPVKAKGLKDDGWHTLSTTNWMPYTWSVNNVAMAEVLNTALAYWQAGRVEEAFRLWKSTILDNMYLGISPANFEQLSFYDAMRGELYRDFADPIGVASRTLVEGLFGIVPDAMRGELLIRPGLPREWDHASLEVPDISYKFHRSGRTDRYTIEWNDRRPSNGKANHNDIDPNVSHKLNLRFVAHARGSKVKEATVNGRSVSWKNVDQCVGQPALEINVKHQSKYQVEIVWSGAEPEKIEIPGVVAEGYRLELRTRRAVILDHHDPQKVLRGADRRQKMFSGQISNNYGHRTFFIKLRQDDFTWWAPVCFEVRKPVEIKASADQGQHALRFRVKNHLTSHIEGTLTVSNGKTRFDQRIQLKPQSESAIVEVQQGILPGTNQVYISMKGGRMIMAPVSNWDLKCPADLPLETIDLSKYFNDRVTNIFRNKYLTPRPHYPTLQLPTQGIGNWCSPLVKADIDDTGLRKLAGSRNRFELPQGIPFHTPGSSDTKNIVFTSRWDNYPEEVSVPLSGLASHAYMLMAGSTDPMQSRFRNGVVVIEYEDGSNNELELRNPETWWPIDQDYYTDGYAFRLNAPKPIRVHLKTGLVTREFDKYASIKGLTDYAIDGGAATVLDIPVDPKKKLKRLTVKATANNVVIGLMSLTLVRV